MAMKRVCSFALLSLAAGCGDRSFSFGDHPDLYWWTDHESGDVSDWTGKGNPGGFILPGQSRVEVVKDVAHSGAYSLLVEDLEPQTRDYPLAARNGPMPLEVYCSAWYYIPEAIHPKTYAWFVLFRSRHAPFGTQDFKDEIRLSFTTRSDGTMGSVLLSEQLGTVQPLVDREIPVGRWFHIEAFLHTATDDSGEFSAWQDGELTFHAKGRTTETTYTEWMIGIVSDGFTGGSKLYIDDAAISRRRLGPLPPFTRE